VRLVTLVLDAPALDRAPRGSGLLVAPGVTDVAAKALTHATAKWRWLAELAGPHRHVLRLSYGRGDEARSVGPENARSAESQAVASGGDRDSDDGDRSEIQGDAGDTGCGVIDVALRDASRLMGVPLSRNQLHAHAVVDFTGQLAASRAAQAAERAHFQQQIAAIAGLSVVGAAVAGTGLSAVVANATAAPLVASGRNSAGSKYDES
jgi:oxygen-dependent protoporphyrinogen oxidase